MLETFTPVVASIVDFLHPEYLLEHLGTYALIGVALIIFAECGLLIGFFLPGDSLLFATGLFVAQGFISTPIAIVVAVLVVAAILGNVVGYWIGFRAGPKLFAKEDSRIFKKHYVDQTHSFFDKYGSKAIVLARFTPIVRTFITAIAGVAKMDYRKFVTFSAIGGVIWAAGVTLLGYFLGNIPFVQNNLEIMLLLIVLVSVVPIAFEIIKSRKEAKLAAAVPALESETI